MDYEKKYKELVGKIEKAYLFAQTNSTKVVLEEIRSELKESDDEKKRKALIEMIHDTPSVECEENYKVSKEDLLAWLEKQGEQQIKTLDFLTIDMVKMHCRIESYDPDPDRQAEIDKNIKEQAYKAEQEVYARIGRNYFDIIKEWGEVPTPIKSAALILTAHGLGESSYTDGHVERMLLQPYKKK